MSDFIESGVFVLNMSVNEVHENFFKENSPFSQDKFWEMQEGKKTVLTPWTNALPDKLDAV
jgi:hypothetical protein